MRLLRRAPKSADPVTVPDDGQRVDPRRTAGKGRPTPKRREAQPRRSGPVAPPPRTRREAYRRMRDRNTGRRQEVREGMRSGDDRYLAPRDQGPARALARDIVDSRRNAGGVFLIVALIVLASYAVPSSSVRYWIMLVWIAAFLTIIVDSIFLGTRIRKLVHERLPADKTRGLTWYGVQRSTMIRRWRMPSVRVNVGDRI